MTVPVNAVKKTVVCDGTTRTWQFNFPLAAQESIEVWVKPPQGAPYRVTDHIVIDRERDTSYTYVTYPALSSGLEPLASGYQIVLARSTPLTQDITFATHVLPETFTSAFDKATLQIQNLDEKISRCVRFDPDPTLTANDTNATSFVSSVLTQAQNTIAAAAGEVTALLPTHNTSAAAHSDIRAALTQSVENVRSALAHEQTLRQNGDNALELTIGNLAGQLSQEISNREETCEELGARITCQGEAIGALQTDVAGKQNRLTSAQQTAVDSGITSAGVAQIQTNKNDIAVLNAQLESDRPWQKPADWIDIRSGALENSVYLLVGHKADYSSYPLFSVYAQVSTAANTYDVYVDGVKQATTASGTVTTLNWQTLALESGWDVTTPSALRTHIVRVTPTTRTDTLTAIRCDEAAGLQQGVLWVHLSLSNPIHIERLICTDAASGANYLYQNRLCQAVTTTEKEIMALGDMRGCCYNAASLEEFPPVNLVQNGNNASYFYRVFGYTKLKKIIIRNAVMRFNQTFDHCLELKEIILENAYNTSLDNYTFNFCRALKRLPTIKSTGHGGHCYVQLSSLENTFIDLSYDNSLPVLDFYGDATHRIDGLKGILVSNSAPFGGASPQINVSYTGLDRAALVGLFRSMPTVSANQICNITGATGAADLTAADLTIATNKGWTVTR